MNNRPYFTADITWCDCGCTNTKCDYHISNLDPLRGSGMYSVADRSKNCHNFRVKNRTDAKDIDSAENVS